MSTITLPQLEAKPNPKRGPFRLIAHDMRYGLIAARRTPFPMVVALLFPLFFNVMFNLIQSGEVVDGVASVQFTTAAIVVFVITAAGYFNMATGMVIAREKSILKRIRQTPMLKSYHLLSRIAVSIVVIATSVIIMILVSAVAFGFEIRPQAIPALIITFLVGSFTSCALGIAITRLIPSIEGALVVSTATLFPLLFVSGVFFPIEGMPAPLQTVIDFLPFAPMIEAIRTTMDTTVTGFAFDPLNLAIITAWGVAGMFIALKTMKWEPQN